MSSIEPVTIISLTPFPKPRIPAPHTLYTPATLPELLPLDSPIYVVLPSIPYTALTPNQTETILRLLSIPAHNVTLFFPDPIPTPDLTAYQILFSAPATVSYLARNLLYTLPTPTTQPLSIQILSHTISGFLLSRPSNFPYALPTTASIVALGASPPPVHTLRSIPGFRLSFRPALPSRPAAFLKHLHSANQTTLLRFPDNTHIFLYPVEQTWHGLLLPHFSMGLVPLLNPVSVTRNLRHPPRIPVHRPILRLPKYHSPDTNVPSFESAIKTVAHRQFQEGKPRPPNMAEITKLDAKILRRRINLAQKASDLRLARFERLQAKNQPKKVIKPIKKHVKAPTMKRSRGGYFVSILSSILPKEHIFFYCHHPRLSWRGPDERLLTEDPVNCHGMHAVDFCDEEHDARITECERLIGKSPVEFGTNKVSSRALRNLKRALAHLRSTAIADEQYREKDEKCAEKPAQNSRLVLKDRSNSAPTVADPVFTALPLPSQIQV